MCLNSTLSINLRFSKPSNCSFNPLTILNIGTGKDISIYDLAYLIRDLVDYNGDIIWDKTKPDGTYRKVLDTTKINDLGWRHHTSLDEGLKKTIEWYKKNIND